MKLHKIIWSVALAAFAVACDNSDDTNALHFGNQVYLNVAATTTTSRVTFKETVDEQERELAAVLAYPSEGSVEVDFAVDPSLVAVYNAKNDTDLKMLDKSHYSLSASKSVVKAGETVSLPVKILFTGLKELEMDVSYLVPVTLAGATGEVSILEGSRTIYYLVRQTGAITVAADLSDGYIWVPSFEPGQPGGAAVNGLMALTYEALVYVNAFDLTSDISAIMGVEQHCLLRFGDSSFPRKQLQMDIGGTKFPKGTKTKELKAGEWYHIAMTWDIETTVIRMYVNGQLQSEGSVIRRPNAEGSKAIDLALDAPTAYRFLIGYAFNPTRQLNGLISEVRVWSVARTQQEIWRDMYMVTDPESKPELRAYWRFNEGQGNVAKDFSRYHNDAACLAESNDMETGQRNEGTLRWNDQVEIPQLNVEQ